MFSSSLSFRQELFAIFPSYRKDLSFAILLPVVGIPRRLVCARWFANCNFCWEIFLCVCCYVCPPPALQIVSLCAREGPKPTPREIKNWVQRRFFVAWNRSWFIAVHFLFSLFSAASFLFLHLPPFRGEGSMVYVLRNYKHNKLIPPSFIFRKL